MYGLTHHMLIYIYIYIVDHDYNEYRGSEFSPQHAAGFDERKNERKNALLMGRAESAPLVILNHSDKPSIVRVRKKISPKKNFSVSKLYYPEKFGNTEDTALVFIAAESGAPSNAGSRRRIEDPNRHKYTPRVSRKHPGEKNPKGGAPRIPFQVEEDEKSYFSTKTNQYAPDKQAKRILSPPRPRPASVHRKRGGHFSPRRNHVVGSEIGEDELDIYMKGGHNIHNKRSMKVLGIHDTPAHRFNASARVGKMKVRQPGVVSGGGKKPGVWGDFTEERDMFNHGGKKKLKNHHVVKNVIFGEVPKEPLTPAQELRLLNPPVHSLNKPYPDWNWDDEKTDANLKNRRQMDKKYQEHMRNQRLRNQPNKFEDYSRRDQPTRPW